MKVKNHRLYLDDDTAANYVASPNYSGDILAHEYLVIHYTAGASAESSIDWLSRREARASAHLVIGRDGSITQMVPFNKRAWHAGISSWNQRVGLNAWSIGIELDNVGVLTETLVHYVDSAGRPIPQEQVMVAKHKYGSIQRGWQLYTEAQLSAARELATVLVQKYQLLDIVGHDDIAPLRKTDPGPAFPMASFRAHVLGRSGEDEGLYRTTATLNIRRAPGTRHPVLAGSPLPPATEVLVTDYHGNWRFVEVLGIVEGNADMEGWVHGRYLEKT